MIYIYGLVDPRTKQIRYIGKSIRPKGRYTDHLNDKSKTHKVHWIQSLLKKGLKPELVILEQLNDDDNWQEYEKNWIKKGKENGWDLVNSTDGGDGVVNLPEESKQRIINAWKGRKHKPETIELLRVKNKGRKHTEEQKKHMSEIMKGREITWADKVSKATRKFDDEKYKEVKELLAQGYKVCELAEKYGVHRTTISKIKLDKYCHERERKEQKQKQENKDND